MTIATGKKPEEEESDWQITGESAPLMKRHSGWDKYCVELEIYTSKEQFDFSSDNLKNSACVAMEDTCLVQMDRDSIILKKKAEEHLLRIVEISGKFYAESYEGMSVVVNSLRDAEGFESPYQLQPLDIIKFGN